MGKTQLDCRCAPGGELLPVLLIMTLILASIVGGCGSGAVRPSNLDGGEDAQATADAAPGIDAEIEPPRCGDGVVDPGEQCDDGNALYGDGCSPDCRLDYDCGNGTCEADAGEFCAVCPFDCCPHCGDGLREDRYGEQCDLDDLAGKTCADYCFDGGALACTSGCELDLSGCEGTGPICGDSIAECDEPCDGWDVLDIDCARLGFWGGLLFCDPGCVPNLTGCYGTRPYLKEDFEQQFPAGWFMDGDWQVGAPTSLGEPPEAHGGQLCAGTVIGGSYSDDNQYHSCTLTYGYDLDLYVAASPVLSFYQYVDTDDVFDGGNVWVSTDRGTIWTQLSNDVLEPEQPLNTVGNMWAYTGNRRMLGWQRVEADLSAFNGQRIRLRFSFHSDHVQSDSNGWYIDDVVVAEAGTHPVAIDTPTPLGWAVTGRLNRWELRAAGGSGSYQWRVQSGSNHQWLTLDPASGLLSGTPDASELGPVSIQIRATDTADASNQTDRTFQLRVGQTLFYESFDNGDPFLWLEDGDWEWGAPSLVGPDTCYDSSSGCFGTNMGDLYSNGNDWDDCRLRTPPLDLTNATAPYLIFYQWLQTEPGWDGGYLWASLDYGSTRIPLDNTVVEPDYNEPNVGGQWAYSGELELLGWHPVEVDLSAFVGETIIVGFSLFSDTFFARAGWYVDELMVVE